jgi:hypothetical protein
LQTVVRLPDHACNPGGREVRALDDVDGIALPPNQSAVGALLKIKVPCRTLDIRERLRWCLLEHRKPPSAEQSEPQIADRLFIVRLANSIEVDHLAIEVVQHFHFGRLFMEKNLSAPGERFDLGRVRRKHCNNAFRKRTLSSYV